MFNYIKGNKKGNVLDQLGAQRGTVIETARTRKKCRQYRTLRVTKAATRTQRQTFLSIRKISHKIANKTKRPQNEMVIKVRKCNKIIQQKYIHTYIKI